MSDTHGIAYYSHAHISVKLTMETGALKASVTVFAMTTLVAIAWHVPFTHFCCEVQIHCMTVGISLFPIVASDSHNMQSSLSAYILIV